MNLLFQDTIAPITSCMGFLESNCENVANAYSEWNQSILKKHGFNLKSQIVNDSLKKILLKLEPLTTAIKTKFLFIPTNSNWTAFFDNGWRGTDAFPVVIYLSEKLSCRGIVVSAVPHTFPSRIKKDTKGRYGATQMLVYDCGKVTRAIEAMNDGGRWVFEQDGDPFLFEELDHYKAKRIRDRFTPEMLEKYLGEFGIEIFNENFYLTESPNKPVMIIKTGNFPPSFKEYTLKEVRKKMGEE